MVDLINTDKYIDVPNQYFLILNFVCEILKFHLDLKLNIKCILDHHSFVFTPDDMDILTLGVKK